MTRDLIKAGHNNQKQANPYRGTLAILDGAYGKHPCAIKSGSHFEPIEPRIMEQCRLSGFKPIDLSFRLQIHKDLSGSKENIHHADLGLVDLRYRYLDNEIAKKIVKQSQSHHDNLLFILAPHTAPCVVKTLCCAGRVVLGDDLLGQLHNELREMMRAKTIVSEHYNRNQSLAAKGMKPHKTDQSTSIQKHTILIAGKPSRHILFLINCLNADHHKIICAYRPGQAIRALETETINGAVFFPEKKGDPLLALARTMRRHTQYQSLPVIHVMPENQTHEDMQASLNGANCVITCEQIIPHAAALIPSVINKTSQISKLQQQLRVSGLHDDLSLAQSMKIRSAKSRLFSAEFFAKHIGVLNKKADQRDQALQFLTFQISKNRDTNMSKNTILRQIGPLVDRIIRAEDFMGHLSNTQHGVVCAATLSSCHGADGMRIAGRISSIVHNTMFYDNQGTPVPLKANATLFTRPKNMCVEETIAGLITHAR